MSISQPTNHRRGYDNVAYSSINSMNYLFLRHTFKKEQPQIIQDELQNFIVAFSDTINNPDVPPSILADLKKCLATELEEGDYLEDITKEQARQQFIDSIESLGCEPSEDVLNFFLSLLDEPVQITNTKQSLVIFQNDNMRIYLHEGQDFYPERDDLDEVEIFSIVDGEQSDDSESFFIKKGAYLP